MPYRYLDFDGVSLPDHNPVDDLSTGAIESTLAPTFNGAVDYWGDLRRLPRSQEIVFKGMYVAQRGSIVDELGRFIVDHGGAGGASRQLLSTDHFFADLRAKTDALKSKRGYRGKLRRQPEDERLRVSTVNDAIRREIERLRRLTPPPEKLAEMIADQHRNLQNLATVGTQWKVARLLSVKHERTLSDLDRVASIEVTFETTQAAWKSENMTINGNGAPVPPGGKVTLTVDGREVVRDAVFKITPRSGPLQSLSLTVNGVTIRWDKPATEAAIAVGTELVIDMGSETIYAGDTNCYSGFTYPAQMSPGWLYLVPGINDIVITTGSVNATYSVEYYDQWT